MTRRVSSRKTYLKKLKLRLAIICTVILAVMVSLMFTASANASKENAGCHKDKYFKSIYIEKGETLWHLAETYADEEYYSNNFEYIKEIKKMNNLKSDNIRSGSYLLVTYYE